MFVKNNILKKTKKENSLYCRVAFNAALLIYQRLGLKIKL
jgi:hypothetical protein